ncbi:MAG: PorV/PorQ family protein [candidate division KSB1 bacterium]|nr:PorV/PorQ family protein [candidate division KSB1 bacterium]
MKGFAFLSTVVGARAGAMGNAYIAMTNDLHAISSNPAALAVLSKRQGAFDYVNHFLDIQSGFGAYLHPLKTGNLAFSLYLRDYGKLDRLDEFGNEDGTFSANSFILTAAYARKLDSQIRVGGAVKYFRSALESYVADGFALDVGVLVESTIFDNLKMAAGIFNLGVARTAFIETRESLPTRVEFGFSKRLAHLPFEWSLAILKYLGDDWLVAAGGEFTLSDNLFFRLGYNSLAREQKVGLADERFAGFSTGLGIIYQKYKIDYSFTSYGVVGSQNRFSITFEF